MTRNRFEDLFSHLRVAGNANLDSIDKFAKLRLFINILNERCMKYVANVSCFNVNESMVHYYGRHECKQYIRGKPICLATSFDMEQYDLDTSVGFSHIKEIIGMQSLRTEEYGVGASVVLEFSEARTMAHPRQYTLCFTTSLRVLHFLIS